MRGSASADNSPTAAASCEDIVVYQKDLGQSPATMRTRWMSKVRNAPREMYREMREKIQDASAVAKKELGQEAASTARARPGKKPDAPSSEEELLPPPEKQDEASVKRLCEIGFSAVSARLALARSAGNPDAACGWLFEVGNDVKEIRAELRRYTDNSWALKPVNTIQRPTGRTPRGEPRGTPRSTTSAALAPLSSSPCSITKLKMPPTAPRGCESTSHDGRAIGTKRRSWHACPAAEVPEEDDQAPGKDSTASPSSNSSSSSPRSGDDSEDELVTEKVRPSEDHQETNRTTEDVAEFAGSDDDHDDDDDDNDDAASEAGWKDMGDDLGFQDLGPPVNASAWEWPPTREEKKHMLLMIERQVGVMVQNELVHELEEMRLRCEHLEKKAAGGANAVDNV